MALFIVVTFPGTQEPFSVLLFKNVCLSEFEYEHSVCECVCVCVFVRMCVGVLSCILAGICKFDCVLSMTD